MHRTGDFVAIPGDFSTTNWDQSTRVFMDIIKNNLTDSDWAGLFKKLHDLSSSRSRAARVKVSAPAEEPVREALLPDDPPSSPVLDEPAISIGNLALD